MACDSLYCAWLKVNYPYELYVTMLKLYDEKKKTDKISSIISEMKRYKNISLSAGRFGQDNRDWLVDKEHSTISQSISSVKNISKQAARDLYKLGLQKEAYMGTEYVSGKLTSEAKKKRTLINSQLKDCEHRAALTEEDVEEEYKSLSKQLEDLLNDSSSWEVQPQIIECKAPLNSFTKVLRALQMNTCLDTRQIRILIELDYFEAFGKSGKLMKIYERFFDGDEKLTKTIKSFGARLKACENHEEELDNTALPIQIQLASQLSNIGLCLTIEKEAPSNLYFVKSIDDKYGVKADLYAIQRGTSGIVRFRKNDFSEQPFEVGDCVRLIEHNKSPKFTYKDGKRTAVPGQYEYWAKKYTIIKLPIEIKER